MKLPFPIQAGENVVLVTRRHWVYFVPAFIAFAVAGLVPPVALLVILSVTKHFKGTGPSIGLIVVVNM